MGMGNSLFFIIINVRYNTVVDTGPVGIISTLTTRDNQVV